MFEVVVMLIVRLRSIILAIITVIAGIAILSAVNPAYASIAILTPDGSGNIRYDGTASPNSLVNLTITATVAASEFGDSVEFYDIGLQSPNYMSIQVSPVSAFSVSGKASWTPLWFNLGGTMSGNTGSFAYSAGFTSVHYDVKIEAEPTDSSVTFKISSMYLADSSGNYYAVFNVNNVPDGVYSIQQDGVEVAKAYVGFRSFTIDLKAGWNLISIPLQPEDDSMDSIFTGDVMSKITDIWGWDELDQEWVYYSCNPDDYFYQYYPKITRIETGRAYWVRMADPASVTVKGLEPKCKPDSPVALVSGWNCVGLTGTSTVELTSQYPDATDIWGWDASIQEWVYYSCDPDDYFYQYYSKLDDIVPGNGYWVRME